MKKFLVICVLFFLTIICLINYYPNNIHFNDNRDVIPLSNLTWKNNNYSRHFGTQLTYRINYNFDSIQTIRYLEKNTVTSLITM